MGFRELPHTADCAIRVWALDLPALFAEAARGMNALAGARLSRRSRTRRRFLLNAADGESLLIAFLTELIDAQEREQTGYDEFDLQVSTMRLTGSAEGGHLVSLSKPIKAATFHNLHIQESVHGVETEIVFDV
jgi:SHS2 domain-containing protein